MKDKDVDVVDEEDVKYKPKFTKIGDLIKKKDDK